MDRRARSPLAIALAGMFAWLAFAVVQAPAARAKLGVLAHYELCEDGDWLSLDDIAVNSATGDVWLEGGIFTPKLVHATTTGAVIGSNPGTGIPNGFSDSFGQSFNVAFTPTGVYVVDGNERYVNSRGRILKYSTARNPVFQSHFKRPPGTIPSDATVLGSPADALGIQNGGDTYIFAIDNGSLVIYDDNGTFVDSLIPVPLEANTKPPHGWGSFLGPGGMASTGRLLYVSDPVSRKVKAYQLGEPTPLFSNRFTLKHAFDYDITVGRIAGANDGSLYGLSSTGLVQISAFSRSDLDLGGAILEELPIEGARGLAVGRDNSIWVTRSDGILRIGPGGDAVPPPQNVNVSSRCGAPRISHSFPTTQQIDKTGYLALNAGCNEPCVLAMTASLQTNVRATAKFPIRATTRRLTRAGKVRFKLRFNRAGVRAIKSAIRRGKNSRVLINLTAVDTGDTVRRQQITLILS
jgi:hypothetical protein